MKLSSFLDIIPVKQETYYKNHSKRSQTQLFIPMLLQQHTSVQHQVDQQYKAMYTVMWKLRSQYKLQCNAEYA